MPESEAVAIVSDLHANIYALEAFLTYLRDYPEVTRILNLGDFVQIGPHPKQTAEIVLNDQRFVNIVGNNEAAVIDQDVSSPNPWRAHTEWTIAELGPDLVHRIRGLPQTVALTLGEKKVMLVHSRPSSTKDLPLLYQGKPLDDFLEDYDAEVDYVLFGHTHYPALIDNGKGKIAINPGSLGCSKESTMSFCLAKIEAGEVSFVFKNVRYDSIRLRDDYLRLAVPHAKLLLGWFFGIAI